MIETSHLFPQLSRKLKTISWIENMLHTIRKLLNRPQCRVMEIPCHHNNRLMNRFPHHHKHPKKLRRHHYDAHNGSGAHLTDISLYITCDSAFLQLPYLELYFVSSCTLYKPELLFFWLGKMWYSFEPRFPILIYFLIVACCANSLFAEIAVFSMIL